MAVEQTDKAPELMRSRHTLQYRTRYPLKVTIDLNVYRKLVIEADAETEGNKSEIINRALSMYFEKKEEEGGQILLPLTQSEKG